MKKILIISPGHMPIIDNKGGAIENLLDLYFRHNDKTNKFKIVAYSVKNKWAKPDDSSTFKNVEFRVIESQKRIHRYMHKISKLFNVLFGTACARFYIRKVTADIKSRGELDAYDLIVVENCASDLAYIGKYLETNTPIVLHLHNDYLGKERVDANRATKYLSQIWCVSDYLRDRVNKIDPGANKAITLYNTINVENFKKVVTKKEKESIRKTLGFDKNDFVFIYVGRIIKEKGVLSLVEAFNKLSANNDNVRLLVIGDRKSLNSIDIYYNLFLRAIRHNERIKYLGRVDNKKLYKYYQIANCQVIPSKCQEAFGLVALEGIITGLPIIYSKRGGLSEIFENNVLGLRKTTSGEILQKMQLLISSNNCKDYIEDKKNIEKLFSREKYCAELDENILRIVNSETYATSNSNDRSTA